MTAAERCARCGRDVDMDSDDYLGGDYIDGIATAEEFVCAACIPGRPATVVGVVTGFAQRYFTRDPLLWTCPSCGTHTWPGVDRAGATVARRCVECQMKADDESAIKPS